MKTVTIACEDDGYRWAHNTHRIILKSEDESFITGWPDRTDPRVSPNWDPAKDRPLLYPKFAWKIVA